MILPREYQQAALDSLTAYFEHRTGNPILVMPTGSGKSLIPALFCRDVLRRWPDQRFLVLAHVKELLEQNYEKIVAVWPDAPAGLYSAGLGRRDTRQPIIVAGIQSVWRKPHVFGWRDIVFVDECHLLGPDSETMYQKFLAGLRATNPAVKLVGLTATAYRLKTGMLHQAENSLFTDVAYEVTLPELLDAGHICPLVSRPPEVQADLSAVGLVGGEFNGHEAEAAVDRAELTERMLDEVYRLGGSRHTWLFFCQGVKHARHVCEALRARGEECEVVTGDTPKAEREDIIRRYKSGDLRRLCNARVLTTGFDTPHIDLIAMVAPTMSPGLYVQICGRGMRTHPSKKDCLVLDFVGNIERHGPITCVRPPKSARPRGAGETHERTCLICPVCRMASELGTAECADCGHLFRQERTVNHDTRAAEADIMAPPPEPAWLPVAAVEYAINKGKDGKRDTLKVTYRCGIGGAYSEWVCFNHDPASFPRQKAEDWWKRRAGGCPPPASVPVAYGLAEFGLKTPCAIRVREEGKFWKVVAYDLSRPAGYHGPAAGGDDPGAGGGDPGSEVDAGEPILF